MEVGLDLVGAPLPFQLLILPFKFDFSVAAHTNDSVSLNFTLFLRIDDALNLDQIQTTQTNPTQVKPKKCCRSKFSFK
jgi:hypothetical protein